jgi:hypothetical protein
VERVVFSHDIIPTPSVTLAASCGFSADILTVDASLVPGRIKSLYWSVLAHVVLLAGRAEEASATTR